MSHCESLQDKHLEELFNHMPGPLPLNTAMHIAPHPRLLSFDIVNEIEKDAVDVASLAAAKSRSCNLQSSVQKDWKQRHSTLLVEGTAEAEPEERTAKACFEHGFCVCRGSGLQVFAMRNRFLRFLKQHIPRSSADRKNLLHSGWIVVQLKQTNRRPQRWAHGARTFCEARSLQERQRSPSSGASRITIWLHIGLRYWSPYRPTFQVLVLKSVQVGTGFCWLEQTGTFLSEFEVWSGLDRNST